MDKYKKTGIIILTILGVICLVAAGCFLISRIIQDGQSEKNMEALRASVNTDANAETETMGTETSHESHSNEQTESENTGGHPAENMDGTKASDDSGANAETAAGESASSAVPNPYGDIFASNEDIAAWLVIPDTTIDYPVMWTPEDENYYLYRDAEGNDDKNGSLILDTDSCLNPLTTNLIIHGHNMRSGAMFGNLTDYESQDYCENHRQIILYTEECRRNYEVIAVFRSQVYKKKDTVFKYYKFFQANTQEEFDDFYQNIKELSLYDTGVTAEFGDHFITLSTCVYHVEQGRFVVVAKEVESGEFYWPVEK